MPRRCASQRNGRVGESHRETGKLRSAAFLGGGRVEESGGEGGGGGDTKTQSVGGRQRQLNSHNFFFFYECKPSIVLLKNTEETLFDCWVDSSNCKT